MVKKILRRLLPWLYITAVIVLAVLGLNYALVDNTTSYTRLMMHEFYNRDDVDILCLGASHCYRGLNPVTVSEKTGLKVCNASSSEQAPDASLALIREAVSMYNVKEVFLEISESMAEETGPYLHRGNMTSTFIVSDYMRPNINKYRFIFECASPSNYFNALMPCRRYTSDILNFNKISNILAKKATDVYQNYQYDYTVSEWEQYAGGGYVASKKQIPEHGFYTVYLPECRIQNISDDWKKSMNQIIDFCDSQGVKLTFYDAPISLYKLLVQGNYDEYIEFIKDFVKGKNVRYAEFNLLKEDVLPYIQSNFKDPHHYNMFGAEAFSNMLADYINGNIPETAFYTTMAEKMADITPDFHGVAYSYDSETAMRTLHMITNAPGYFEYKLELTEEDGGKRLLRDFDTSTEFVIRRREMVIPRSAFQPELLVTFRRAGSGEAGETLVFKE